MKQRKLELNKSNICWKTDPPVQQEYPAVASFYEQEQVSFFVSSFQTKSLQVFCACFFKYNLK